MFLYLQCLNGFLAASHVEPMTSNDPTQAHLSNFTPSILQNDLWKFDFINFPVSLWIVLGEHVGNSSQSLNSDPCFLEFSYGVLPKLKATFCLACLQNPSPEGQPLWNCPETLSQKLSNVYFLLWNTVIKLFYKLTISLHWRILCGWVDIFVFSLPWSLMWSLAYKTE